MTHSQQAPSAALRALGPAVFLSGASGLLAEALWLRLLTPVLGSGTQAVCLVLSGFMAGLAAGGWVIGRRADSSARPARLYAGLELAAALWTAAAPFLVRSWDSPWAALLLLPPAFATGGALPLLARAVPEAAGPAVAGLYFWNNLGGAAGAAVAAVSVAVFGVTASFGLSGLLGLAAAVLAWRYAGVEASNPRESDLEAPASVALPASVWVLFAICGAATLAHEALWTRLLGLAFGSTTQAFAAVLAAFLAGLAWGGPLARRLLRGEPAPAAALGWLQTAAAAASVLALAAFPFLPRTLVYVYTSGLPAAAVAVFQAGLAFAFLAVPAACLGASLPVVSEAVRGRKGASVGALYAAGTAAAAAGPWAASFLLVPWLGLVGAVGAAALANLGMGVWGLSMGQNARRRRLGFAAAAACACAWLALPVPSVGTVQSGVAVYAAEIRKAGILPSDLHAAGGYGLMFAEDGTEASVSVWGDTSGRHALVINGKTDASDDRDMVTERMLGHLPVLAGEPPSDGRALVIGLGSGVTAAAVARHPFSEVVVSELEPAVAHASALFREVNRDILHDPRVRLELKDARALLRAERGRFSLIVSEPSNPWISGMSHLFSADFLALARSRLAPGGVFCQWIPLYKMSPEAMATALETVRLSFPYVSVWSLKSDLILVASERSQRPDFDRILSAMDRPGVTRDLAEIEFKAPSDILALRIMGEQGVRALAAEASAHPHTDDRPYLEFLAPAALADLSVMLENGQTLERHAEPLAAAVSAAGKERWLARSLIAAGRADAASTVLDEVATDDLWRRGLERDLAELYIRTGRAAQGAAVFERRAGLSPEDPDAWLDLARARLEAGDSERGFAAFSRYESLDAGGDKVRAMMAQARRERGRGKALEAVAVAMARRGRGAAAALVFQGLVAEGHVLH